MRGHRGYNSYFENWTPTLMENEGDETTINELFVQETLDPRIESVMPILSKLSKTVSEMKEVKELDEWADSLIESPDDEVNAHNESSDEKNMKRKELEEVTDAEKADIKIKVPAYRRDKVTTSDLEKAKEKNISGPEGLKALNTKVDSNVKEGLGPEQKRVGQLGPTEKVKKNSGARGKLVGANESVEQGVAEGSINDYFKRRKDEEDRIAGTKAPAKRTPQQTDYAKRRAQEKKDEQGVAEGQEDLEEATSMKQQWKNDVKQVHGNNVRFEVNKAVRSNEETQSEAYDENGNKVAYFYHKSGRQNILPKPKVNEDLSKTDIKKQISKFEELALAANRAGDDEKSKQYQRKIQSLKQKMSQDVKEGLGPEQKRVGQLGPTEKVKKNSGARGKLVGANESVEQGVAEGIKGWKHAHSDMMKHRAESGKDVHLVSLKKDGTESKMHDAKKSFKSEEEARAHHKRVKELNPNRTIAHNLYVGGKVEKLS
jgi:hypothetical protein